MNHLRLFPPSGSISFPVLGLWMLSLAACAADTTSQPESMVDGRLLTSASGALTATFDMDSPAKGLNALSIQVLGQDDQAMEGAQVSISPWMPAHGHGSIDTEAVDTDAGHYVADDVYFNMTGYWELHVDVTPPDQPTDSFLVPVHVR